MLHNPDLIQEMPPKGMIAATNGQYLAAAPATNVFWLKNFITLKRPQAVDVTPTNRGSYSHKQIALDPFFTKTAIPAYLLASDGTNSAAFYNANIASPVASENWTKGANQAGVYTVIRATNVAGGILIYSPGVAPGGSQLLNFTVSDYGASFPPQSGWTPTTQGQWVSGQGFVVAASFFASDENRNVLVVDIPVNLGASTITSITFTYDWVKGLMQGGSDPGDFAVQFQVNGATVYSSIVGNEGNGYNKSRTVSGSWTGNITIRCIVMCSRVSTSQTPDGVGRVIQILLGAADAKVRYSSDKGATFGSVLAVGASPGSVGGFDVQRSGAVSYAAADGSVYKASTLGGAYSLYYSTTGGAQPVCIIIPYFTWSGAKQTDTANPDMIVALDRLDGSSRSLLWIEGGVTPGTVHDITPVAGIVFANANCVTVAYNHHIACFGNVSGTPKLYTTNNQGSTWTNRGTLTTPQFLRTRRNDNRASVSGTNKGQLYLAGDSDMAYTSAWASGGGSDAGLFPRTMPATPITSFDILY